MADPNLISPENVPGEFYVDLNCIRCAACWKEAPANISSHAIETYAYFSRQPRTASEREACERALKICPVQSIGKR